MRNPFDTKAARLLLPAVGLLVMTVIFIERVLADGVGRARSIVYFFAWLIFVAASVVTVFRELVSTRR
jgi:hypothetical protein